MSRPAPGRLAACVALGAVLGTLLDGIHLYGGVLAYPDPAFGRWAWWVPPEFGLVGLGAAFAVAALEPRVGPPQGARWSVDAVLGELALFASLYLATSLVAGKHAAWLAAGLLALVGLRTALAATPGDWAYALGAAILGPLGEIVISGLGAFEYLEPDVAGIPYWLPALWANGGLLARRLVAPLVTRGAARAASPSGGRARARGGGRGRRS